MTRNIAALVIVGLIILAAGLGYQVYQDHQSDSSIKIDIGKTGVSIQSH